MYLKLWKALTSLRRPSVVVLLLAFLGGHAFGQSAGAFAAAAGVDLSGNWTPAPHDELVGNPALVEYYGVPINEAARAFGLAWSPSRATLPEHQCQVHLVSYIYGGPLNLRIWEEKDPQSQRLVAIRQYISTYEQSRTIWMDGRPHPSPSAPHTWMGFSTGKWEGTTLTVYTTHIKQGELRRNGLLESDQATLVEHFVRYGDILTHVSIVTDPATLTEPFIRTQAFRLTLPEGQNWLYPCEYVEEIADRPRGAVPHFLPGENPFLREHAQKLGIPLEAALGGPETMYPDFRLKLKSGSFSSAAPSPSAASSSAGASTTAANPPAAPADPNAELEVLLVQGNVYLIAGAGGNIGVQIGEMGVVVVDTGLAQNSGKVLAAIRKLSDKPIQYVINTHMHADHTGGNEVIRRAGVTITGANVAGDINDATQGAQIIAHLNVLQRVSAPTGKQAVAPEAAWPTETYVSGQKELFFNEEPIAVMYQKKAHTDGDSLVYFRRSDVVATGDVFVTTSYPYIDLENGGGIQGEIDALNNILDLTIPKHDEEGGTYVIPGHGRICDEYDVLEYRDMVTIVRDRVQNAIRKGMTLEQVRSAGFTRDFDSRYNAAAGFGTADNFVTAIYKSLSGSARAN